MKNGFVQFTDDHGKVITTNGSLTFVKEAHRNLAFYGSRGHSSLNDAEFDKVLADIGLPVVSSPASVADDEDSFTIP